MKQQRIVKVGVVQMRCVESAAENLNHAVARVAKLAKRGADIVCLPELFLTPYFCQTIDKRWFAMAEAIPGPTSKALGAAAKQHKVTIITSLFERAPGGKFYNTAVVLGPTGKLLGKYRKMHIPDDLKNYYGEADYFSAGNLGVQAIRTESATVGPLICWDQWFPESARMAALKGAEFLFYPTAIGWQLKERPGIKEAEHEAWQTIQRAHAIANNVFVVTANRVGLEGKLKFWGTSFVIDPYGRVIAQAPSDREADLLVSCDRSLISTMRRDWPFLKARQLKVK